MPTIKIKQPDGSWKYTNEPSSNADTLDGKHADEFATASDVEALQTKVGDASVSEQINTALDNYNADWNASEGEEGYIENRTHWTSYDDIIFPETTLSWDETTEYMATLELSAPLVIGNYYKVVQDGIEYITKCLDVNGDGSVPGIGCFVDMGFEDTGEPFTIIYLDGVTMFFTKENFAGNYTSGSATVSIIAQSVHKIDKKYIPATTYVIKDVTDNIINESYDNFADILWNGGSVWIEVSSSDDINREQVIQFSANGLGSSGGGFNLMTMKTSILNTIDTMKIYIATNGTWRPPTT